jgi:hypothetical protein
MKANFTLFDPIQMEGKCAVTTGEDTDVEARTQKEMRGPTASFYPLWLQNSGSASYRA